MVAVDVEAVRRVVLDAAAERARGMAADIANLYRDEAPRDTGLLGSAFRYEVTVDDGGASIRVHGEVDDDVAPHGKWIDQPVDEIVPVRARALHFFAKSGDEVFARRVVPSREHEGWWRRFVARAVAEVIER